MENKELQDVLRKSSNAAWTLGGLQINRNLGGM